MKFIKKTYYIHRFETEIILYIFPDSWYQAAVKFFLSYHFSVLLLFWMHCGSGSTWGTGITDAFVAREVSEAL